MSNSEQDSGVAKSYSRVLVVSCGIRGVKAGSHNWNDCLSEKEEEAIVGVVKNEDKQNDESVIRREQKARTISGSATLE